MKWYQHVIAYAIMGSSIGCDSKTEQPVNKEYFMKIHADTSPGLMMTSGDFDKDGNLDVIVANADNELFFLKGDGKGNFELKRQ